MSTYSHMHMHGLLIMTSSQEAFNSSWTVGGLNLTAGARADLRLHGAHAHPTPGAHRIHDKEHGQDRWRRWWGFSKHHPGVFDRDEIAICFEHGSAGFGISSDAVAGSVPDF